MEAGEKKIGIIIHDKVNVGYDSIDPLVEMSVVLPADVGLEDEERAFQELKGRAIKRWNDLVVERLADLAKRKKLIPDDLNPRDNPRDTAKVITYLIQHFRGK